MGPTPEESERLTQVVVAKATRILALVEAPLGTVGEVTEFGVAQTRPDYASQELLLGLRWTAYTAADLGAVTPEMVIRQGLQTDPANYPADKLPDVQRAIDAATDWVVHSLRGLGAA